MVFREYTLDNYGNFIVYKYDTGNNTLVSKYIIPYNNDVTNKKDINHEGYELSTSYIVTDKSINILVEENNAAYDYINKVEKRKKTPSKFGLAVITIPFEGDEFSRSWAMNQKYKGTNWIYLGPHMTHLALTQASIDRPNPDIQHTVVAGKSGFYFFTYSSSKHFTGFIPVE
ncbi:MAG: hypothetical protein JKY42_04645 [Flavobacteriales bacterium]|nr:hypothetical protein [Flavobacteriales bacterium]